MHLKNYHIYNQNGLILETDTQKYVLTNFSCPHFGCALQGKKIVIIYENQCGNLIKITEYENRFEQETILVSKSGIFSDKEINLQIKEQKLHLFFSSYYKGKKMILYYPEKEPIRIFDFCDESQFQTLLCQNGELFVLYQKNGSLGYSIVQNECYSEFVPLNVKNPIKLLELNSSLYLLAKEKYYIIYNISQQKKFVLPPVFYKKPFLYQKNGSIYLMYRHMHRYIYYILTENGVEFLKEEEY